MKRVFPRVFSLGTLAACLAASLIFRRFVFVAWYPVLMSAALALAFGFSLFTTPLCRIVAERLAPGGLLPVGAEAYCRRLTGVWCAALAVNLLVALGTVYGPRWAWVAWNCALSYAFLGLVGFVETRVRRRRFAVTFHTSGSTSAPKTIVKTFDSLAKEVAMHRARLADVLAEKPLVLATIEPGHMYGTLWRELLPRAAGLKVDPEVILSPESLLAKMRAAEKVLLVTTPSFLARFAAYADQYDVPRNVVEITTSGAWLKAETSAAAARIFGRAPLEIFGSTETGGVAWRRQGGAPAAFDWEVFPGVKVAVEAGRLVVESPFSFTRRYVMGDGAELAPDARRFRLLGRLDRLVKIAEQRVSLPEMEERMGALEGVAEAALVRMEGEKGPYLGAVVVPDPACPPPAPTKKAAALALRARLLAFFPRGTVPKKYRFVSELPRNAQGKILAAELRRLFETDFAEPFVTRVERGEGIYAADFTFPADAFYFSGHFPGFPILPGVVQVALAHRFAERLVRRPLRLASVRKMKFTQIVRPGDTVRFMLRRTSETEFAYRFAKGEETCSTGILLTA